MTLSPGMGDSQQQVSSINAYLPEKHVLEVFLQV